MRQVLHCPHCHGPDRIRPGKPRHGTPRSCGPETVGDGRPFLVEDSSAGHAAAITPQRVDRARNARGRRETARVLPGSPPPVSKARQQKRRSCRQCIMGGWRAGTLSRARGKAGARMRWRGGVDGAPSAPTGGGWCQRQHLCAGAGTPWLPPPGRGERRGAGGGRTTSAWGGTSGESPWASPRMPPTAGGPRRGIARSRSSTEARSTRRKARASPSISGPGARGWCVARGAFPRRHACTIWCVGCAAIGMHVDEPSELDFIH